VKRKRRVRYDVRYEKKEIDMKRGYKEEIDMKRGYKILLRLTTC